MTLPMPPRALFACLPLALALSACQHAATTPASTVATASAPRVLLLGEVHDSAAGHAARALLLRKEVEAGWRPAIAMEQFDTVQQPLLDAALNEPEKALAMVNVFSRSTLAAPPSALGPGTWVYGASLALGRRVIRSNARVNVFHRGFKACDSYTNAENAIAQVTCPVLFLLGAVDQMTQPRAAQPLVAAVRAAGKTHEVVYLPGGHHQMTETPEETLTALKAFLARRH